MRIAHAGSVLAAVALIGFTTAGLAESAGGAAVLPGIACFANPVSALELGANACALPATGVVLPLGTAVYGNISASYVAVDADGVDDGALSLDYSVSDGSFGANGGQLTLTFTSGSSVSFGSEGAVSFTRSGPTYSVTFVGCSPPLPIVGNEPPDPSTLCITASVNVLDTTGTVLGGDFQVSSITSDYLP
jgi:hypothetical protein